MDISSDKEINAALLALQAWFQSQEIKPNEAVVIMCKFIAELSVHNSSTTDAIGVKLGNVIKLLTMEIGQALKGD